MFFVIVQPEMPATAAGIPSGIAGDLSPLTATQFAAHAATYQPVRGGSSAATDAANWIAIS